MTMGYSSTFPDIHGTSHRKYSHSSPPRSSDTSSVDISPSSTPSSSDGNDELDSSIGIGIHGLSASLKTDHSLPKYRIPLGALRPRRRGSLGFLRRMLRRRILSLIIALSVPLLAWILSTGVKVRNLQRQLLEEREIHERMIWDIEEGGGRREKMNLSYLRGVFEKRRRRELVRDLVAERGTGWRILGKEKVEWSLDDEAMLRVEVEKFWPKWWGNSDVVGKSPFDYQAVGPVSEDGKRRVLFLTDYVDYLERMNTHTYEIVDGSAALRHPGLIVDVWGPNWAGYDPTLPLSINVRRRARRVEQLEKRKIEWKEEKETKHRQREEERRLENEARRFRKWADVTKSPLDPWLRIDEEVVDDYDPNDPFAGWMNPDWEDVIDVGCGEIKWDIVWTFSDIFKQNDPLVDALDCDALLIQQIGDCHELRCFNEWYPLANNITLSKYAFELLEIFPYEKVKSSFPDFQMGIFGHSPDTANEWDFWPIPWKNKTSDATLFGFDGSFYPIRTTISDYITLNPDVLSPIIRHEHPGYVVSYDEDLRDHPMETYEIGHESYAIHRSLREDFAAGMRQTRICVFDSSLERKMIRKYAQAFLSGCVVAADLPTEQEEALSNFIIRLEPSWPIEKIHQQLQYYLGQPDRLEQMALDAFAYARQYLTTTKKIDQVLRMADSYRAGNRGYDYPYSFSSRCRSYSWHGVELKTAWCGGQGYQGWQ